MEEKVLVKTAVKKTTRKRVVPEGTVPRVRAVRKTAEASPVRKAPTRTAASMSTEVSSASRADSRKLKVTVIGVGLFALLLGVSALIGMSDKGELDVASAISQRKQNAGAEEKQALESVPTEQINPSAPNGGLVGMGAPPPVVQVPEAIASSTELTATTTKTTESTSTEGTQGNEEVLPSEAPAKEEPQATQNTTTGAIEA